MTLRYATILGVSCVALVGSLGAVWSVAPNGTENDVPTAQLGSISLAATDDEVKACKQACSNKYQCGAITGPYPGKKDCLDKAAACKQACDN